MDLDNPNTPNVPGRPDDPFISKKQKLMVAALIVIVVAVLGMWAVQFRSNLRNSLTKGENKPNSSDSGQTPQNQASSEEELKNKDTDHDGLSDWDELNIYHTSPYLEDTDGDGIPDGVEVKNGTDPNCPQGRTCSQSPAAAQATSTQDANLGNIGLTTQNATNTQQLENMLGGQSDAASLRQALLKAGMDPKILDQLSDEDLMKSYEQTLNNPPQ